MRNDYAYILWTNEKQRMYKRTNIQIMRLYKTAIIVVAVVLALWVLPWLYSFLLPATGSDGFVYYSPYTGDFIVRNADGFCDCQGHGYTDAEADSLLPYFFYRQLVADQRLPDTLFGEPADPKVLRRESFTFKTSPAQINKPRTPLYELLDTESGRVDLQLPADVFRLTADGLAFITAATNRIDIEKSRMFNSVLRAHGCVFPIRLIAGNPSTRKAYDNGYLLADSQGRLFNLRMRKGSPAVRDIVLPEGVKAQNLFVTEFDNMRHLGFLVSTDQRLYAIDAKTLTLDLIDIPEYNPQEMPILIMGNPHDWTIRLLTAHDTRYYAVSATDYSLLAERIVPDPAPTTAEKIYRCLFPLRLSLRTWQTPTVFPRWNVD